MFASRVVASSLNSRLDAGFYDPRYAAAESKLRASGVKVSPFEDHLERVFKGAFYILAAEYSGSGIPFIRVSQISSGQLDLASAVYLPEHVHQREQKPRFAPGTSSLLRVEQSVRPLWYRRT